MPRYSGDRPKYAGRVLHDAEFRVAESRADTPVVVVEAFSSAMEQLFPALPGTISELRTALGGTNKAAQAIGVTPRSIQRYIAAEEMRHSQTRRADIAKRGEIVRQLQNALAPQLRGKREAAIRHDGVVATMLGSLRIGPGYTEGRFIHWRIEGRYWDGKAGILAAWNAGKVRQATQRFQRAFAKSYGLPEARWSYLNELTFEPPS